MSGLFCFGINSNLQMKLIKDRADFINNGTARYIADAFNIINVDINAQTISFSAGGPTCCALAQKILSNNKYYCSMIFLIIMDFLDTHMQILIVIQNVPLMIFMDI